MLHESGTLLWMGQICHIVSLIPKLPTGVVVFLVKRVLKNGYRSCVGQISLFLPFLHTVCLLGSFVFQVFSSIRIFRTLFWKKFCTLAMYVDKEQKFQLSNVPCLGTKGHFFVPVPFSSFYGNL